jgi:hypothetical protein
VRPLDTSQAAAESRLDRFDREEAPEITDGLDPGLAGADARGFGYHLDDPEADLLEDDLDAGLRDDGEADALDLAATAFNARDLDELVGLMAADGEAPGLFGADRASLAEAIEQLWERRPTCCVTRGRVEVDHVGVLWEHDGTDWWRVAVIHVDDVVDGRIGVLELSEDTDLLDRVECEPPDDDLLEGSRWAEWDEGTDTP